MFSLYASATDSPAIAPTESAVTTDSITVFAVRFCLFFFAAFCLSADFSSSPSCSAYATSAAFLSSSSLRFMLSS